MISTRFVKMAVSGLALGIALTGGHAGPATSTASPAEAKQLALAAKAAADANAALGAKDARKAIAAAEIAVTYSPRDPGYRLLLGQAYLSAGRFTSAETTFSDALTLTPDNGRAALNLALTQIAQGKRDVALSTLADYRDKMAAADFGLAVGLAGDPETAVATLENAIRSGASDAKTRQNLALAYAMEGNWESARIMASQDLAANDVDVRLGQWAAFVRPKSSYDQVASLLNVRPVQDAGQPAHLALNAVTGQAVAAAAPVQAAPEPMAMPVVAAPAPVAAVPVVAQAAPVAAPVIALPVVTVAAQVATPVAAPVVTAAVAPVAEAPVFETPAPAKPATPVAAVTAVAAPIIYAGVDAVKQMIAPTPVRRVANVAKPMPRTMPQAPRSVIAGKFVVQLGAFQNAAVSRNSWGRLAPRFGLTGFDPANSVARVNGANFVRLSVGGFSTRAEAVNVCVRIRNAGGACFVRGMFRDAPAQWAQRATPKFAKPVRLASR